MAGRSPREVTLENYASLQKILRERPEAERVHRAVMQYSRGPMQEILSLFLMCPPTPQAVTKLAQRNPERWAIALGKLAELAGYAARVDVHQSRESAIDALSDAELQQRVADARAKVYGDSPQNGGKHGEA